MNIFDPISAKKHILLFAIALITLAGCENYAGEKTDLSFIETPDYTATRQVAYVPVLPVLSDFIRPVDITIGFDDLLYVVDEGSQEVIALDLAGNILGRKTIPGAKAVAHDRQFDLLVIGTLDTNLVQGSDIVMRRLSCIYRLDQFAGGTYDLSSAKISNKIVHPFYYKNSASDFDEIDNVSFQKVDVIGDNSDPIENNSFFVTRNGTNTTGVLGPDDAVVFFNSRDEFSTTINVNTASSGVRDDYFQKPMGISTFTKPPQINAVGGRNFIYTSLEPSNSLKVQRINFVSTEFGSSYDVDILATGLDTTEADGFINEPNKFKEPTDIFIAGDGTNDIFVCDRETDSVYQFSSTGLEGVEPEAASGLDKFQIVSFGGTGSGETQFNNPMAVTHYKDILYVADADNGRILRFQLTTDFD